MKRYSMIAVLGLAAALAAGTVAAQSTLVVRGENDVPGPVIVDVYTAGDLGSPVAYRGTLTWAGNDNTCSDLTLTIPSGTQRIRFVFTNDFFNGPADIDDRNAYIDYFTIDGVRTEGENFSTLFPAPGEVTATCGGTAVAIGVNNGYAEFVLAAPALAAAVPALSPWAVLLLMVLSGFAAAYALRRRARAR